jgi:hypothetical protein
MMFNHRLTRTAAVVLTVGATVAPAASAMPADGPASTGTRPTQDLRNPDTRDYADGRRVYTPVQAPGQDLRSPDTRDYADGRGTHNAPRVVVVKAPAPAAAPTSSGGVDWADVGIGAGGLLGAGLITLGGALVVLHRRAPRPRTAA